MFAVPLPSKTQYNKCLLLQGNANLGAATKMRLSLVFELLLIFILLAFAASRVIGKWGTYREVMFVTTGPTLFFQLCILLQNLRPQLRGKFLARAHQTATVLVPTSCVIAVESFL